MDAMFGPISDSISTMTAKAVSRANINLSSNPHAEIIVELGVLGPHVSADYSLSTFSLLGFEFKCDTSIITGPGMKAALGAGAALNKTTSNLRFYEKLGAFTPAAGAEFHLQKTPHK